jgi:hypothetical protein
MTPAPIAIMSPDKRRGTKANPIAIGIAPRRMAWPGTLSDRCNKPTASAAKAPQTSKQTNSAAVIPTVRDIDGTRLLFLNPDCGANAVSIPIPFLPIFYRRF